MKNYHDFTFQNPYTKEIVVDDKKITIEIGKFSEQVEAAVLVTCGETVVHVTLALGRKANIGYFPLFVEYEEKMYAGGKIKGSRWVKREGRPSDEAILKARIIDRTLRPLFTEGITNEVQVIATVLSVDGENDADMLALLGSCIAAEISSIPFDGPVAGLRVGYLSEKKKFVFNPNYETREASDLDLIVCGNEDGIVMVEADASEITEDIMLQAFDNAQKQLGNITSVVQDIRNDLGKEKFEVEKEELPSEFIDTISKKYKKEIHDMVVKKAQLQETGLDNLIEEIVAQHEEQAQKEEATEIEKLLADEKALREVFYELMKQEGRRMILEDNVRPDGRKTDEIREISCAVDVLPRTHGSAMFKRGATQALTITTLASPSMGQWIEDLEGEDVRHYIHHYYMPPFASGETGRVGWPKRREVGHGMLAERALLPMIPSQTKFPYTIRVVSEIMSSNGSTSQASVCGSTLSLMAAGVPIKKPVAGIAMGFMSDGKGKYVILSDIQGLEDHTGDMDFKVAGSKDGITAIQMDIKIKRIPMDIMKQALQQAKVGRLHILGEMLKTLKTPREQLSKLAPKIVQIRIPSEKIGELIGPGGKVIKEIIARTGAEVDVDEDHETEEGIVNITSEDVESINKAQTWIENMMREVEIGEEYEGEVVRIENYGAFVTILPGKDGLVHVSSMATEYVSDPRDIVSMGDTVKVRVIDIDDMGRIKLSMLTEEEEQQAKQRGGGGRSNRGRSNGGRSNGRRNNSQRSDRGSRGNRDRGRGGNSGSHRSHNKGSKQKKNDGFSQKRY